MIYKEAVSQIILVYKRVVNSHIRDKDHDLFVPYKGQALTIVSPKSLKNYKSFFGDFQISYMAT